MRNLRPADPGVATMFLPGMVDDGVAVVVGRLERGSTEARARSSEKGTLGQKRSVRTHAVSDWRAAAISIPTLFRVKQGLSTKAAVEASYGGLGGRWKRGY